MQLNAVKSTKTQQQQMKQPMMSPPTTNTKKLSDANVSKMSKPQVVNTSTPTLDPVNAGEVEQRGLTKPENSDVPTATAATVDPIEVKLGARCWWDLHDHNDSETRIDQPTSGGPNNANPRRWIWNWSSKAKYVAAAAMLVVAATGTGIGLWKSENQKIQAHQATAVMGKASKSPKVSKSGSQASQAPSTSLVPSGSPSLSNAPSCQKSYIGVPESTYQYFRFTPTKLRDPLLNPPIVQLSEMQLYSCGTQLDVQTATNPEGSRINLNEGPLKAIDGDVNTKWLDFNAGTLILEFSSSVSMNEYLWYTANDEPARDPTRWTLEGSDDGTSWTMIDDRSGTEQTVPRDRFTAVVV